MAGAGRRGTATISQGKMMACGWAKSKKMGKSVRGRGGKLRGHDSPRGGGGEAGRLRVEETGGPMERVVREGRVAGLAFGKTARYREKAEVAAVAQLRCQS